jgi:hypothetical protein
MANPNNFYIQTRSQLHVEKSEAVIQAELAFLRNSTDKYHGILEDLFSALKDSGTARLSYNGQTLEIVVVPKEIKC